MKPKELNSKDNTPKHCWECWKFKDCHQAQNMTANTPAVQGYAYDADMYCADCLDTDLPKATSLGTNECDIPSHCAACGVPLECDLLPEGIRYLKESIAEGAGCCQELWPRLFSDYLD